MILIKDLPLFEPIENVSYVDDGVLNIIYRLDGQSCVKVGKRIDKSDARKLLREAEIAENLYHGGVSVPRPLGIFRFSVSSFEALPSPLNAETFLLGFVQEFIEGSFYRNLPKDFCEEAKRKYAEEMDKVKALGFIRSPDSPYNSRNVLYQFNANSLERAVLLDFEFWGIR